MNTRKNVCLNGLWNFAPSADGDLCKLPEKYSETEIIVPSPYNVNSFAGFEVRNYNGEEVMIKGGEYNFFPGYEKEWEYAAGGFYNTKFFAPWEWKDQIITLKFNAVCFYSECYINGKLVYTDIDGFLPFEFGINNYVNYGEENELIVAVRKASEYIWKDKDGREKTEYPMGSFWGEHIGGIWQDVFLNVYPDTYIDDVFVTTDVQKNILDCKVNIFNPQDNLKIIFDLEDKEENKLYNFGEVVVNKQNNEFQHTFNYSDIKDRIKLWSNIDPNLYILNVKLYNTEGMIDNKKIRFGFRTFEIKGKKCYLNGHPINLKNDSWHYMGFAYQKEEYAKKWYIMAKDANVNCIRLHAQVYPEFFVDIADEMGMLIIDESAVWASHCRFHYSMSFIENSKKHVERLIKRDRNHPSVIAWSIENECVMAYGVNKDYAVKDKEELYMRLSLIAEHAKKFDKSRPLNADGSKDLDGSLEIVSVHYPGKYCNIDTQKPIFLGEMGSMYYSHPDMACDYLGEDAYLSQNNRLENLGREVFQMLKHHRKWASQVCVFNLVWYGLQPLKFKEKIMKYENYNTPGIKVQKIGEYISTINAGYDDELPDYIPTPFFEWVKRAYINERIFFEQDKFSFYCNENSKISLSVFNDSQQNRDYLIRFNITDNKKAICEGVKEVYVEAADYSLTQIGFKAPQTQSVKNYTLNIKLEHNGETLFEEGKEIKVFNKNFIDNLLPENVKVAVVGDRLSFNVEFYHMGNFYFVETVSAQDEYDAYIINSEIGDTLYDLIISFGQPIIDISMIDKNLKEYVHKKNIVKGFFATRNQYLCNCLDDDFLVGFENDLFASSYIDVNLNEFYIPLIYSGNGSPLAIDAGIKTSHILTTLKLIDFRNPAAYQLLVNFIQYGLKKEKADTKECVLITEKESILEKHVNKLNISHKLISPDEKMAIKSICNMDTIIVDGGNCLEFMNELTSTNVKNIIVYNLKNNNIPLNMKGFFEVVEKPVYQMYVNKKDDATALIHISDLYGADPTNLNVITQNPIKILDNARCTGLIKNTAIDWRTWNNIGENKKTISLLRSELNNKDDLYMLIKMSFNGINIYVNQLNIMDSNEKAKLISKKIMFNFNVQFLENLITQNNNNSEIYNNKIIKHLTLKFQRGSCEKQFSEIEKISRNEFRVLSHDNFEELEEGHYIHCFDVYSPSDRTDLLLNPDLIYMSFNTEFDSVIYLNGNIIYEGKNLVKNTMLFKRGRNKIMIRQYRNNKSSHVFNLIFERKGLLPLDLKFDLGSDDTNV